MSITVSNQDIEFGIFLHTFDSHASPSSFLEIADAAERTEFDAVWIGDHVVFPEEIPNEYPFSPTNEPPSVLESSADMYSTFEVVSYLAAATEDIAIGTNTCVAPYRHPVALTKSVFSVSELSGGRFNFGVASGWMSTEFEALDVPFGERGARTDEFLDIFRRARSEQEFAFAGPFHDFDTLGFHPVPDPEDVPPIFIGGHSGAAFRRTAEFGDGWTIYGLRPSAVKSGYDRLMNAWEDYDRSGTPEVVASRAVHVGSGSDIDESRPLVGSPESIAADIEAYIDAGTTHLLLDFYTLDLDEQIEQIERFNDEVLGEFR